jgi:hypothetical protein
VGGLNLELADAEQNLLEHRHGHRRNPRAGDRVRQRRALRQLADTLRRPFKKAKAAHAAR